MKKTSDGSEVKYRLEPGKNGYCVANTPTGLVSTEGPNLMLELKKRKGPVVLKRPSCKQAKPAAAQADDGKSAEHEEVEEEEEEGEEAEGQEEVIDVPPELPAAIVSFMQYKKKDIVALYQRKPGTKEKGHLFQFGGAKRAKTLEELCDVAKQACEKMSNEGVSKDDAKEWCSEAIK